MNKAREARSATAMVCRVSAWLLVPAFLLVFCLGSFAGLIDIGLTARAVGAYEEGIWFEGSSLWVRLPNDITNMDASVVVSSCGDTETVRGDFIPGSGGGTTPICKVGADAAGMAQFALAQLEDKGVISSDLFTDYKVYVYYGNESGLVELGSIVFMPGAATAYIGSTAYILPMAGGYVLYWPTGVGDGYLVYNEANEGLMLECGGQSILLDGEGINPLQYCVYSGGNDAEFYYAFLQAEDVSGLTLSVVGPAGNGYAKLASIPVIQSANGGGITGVDYGAMLGSTDARDFFSGLLSADRIVDAWLGFESPACVGEELFAYREALTVNQRSFSASDVVERILQYPDYEYMNMTYNVVYLHENQLCYASGSGRYYPDWILFTDAAVNGYYDYVDIRLRDIHSNTAEGVKLPYNAGTHGGIGAMLSNGNSYDGPPIWDSRTIEDISALISGGSLNYKAPCFEADAQAETGSDTPPRAWDLVEHGDYTQEPLLWFVAGSSNTVLGTDYDYISRFPGYGMALSVEDYILVNKSSQANVRYAPSGLNAYFNTIGEPPVNPDPVETPPVESADIISGGGDATTTPTQDNEVLYDPLDIIERGLADVSRASAFIISQNADGTFTLTVNLSEEALLQANEDGYTTFLIDLDATDLDLEGMDPTQLHYQVNIPQSAADSIGHDSVVRVNSQAFSADIPWSEVNPVGETVEITVDVIDLGSEVLLPIGRRLGADTGIIAYAAYAARQVAANTRSLASSAYNISVSKVNTQTQEKTPVTTFAAKPVVVSIPQSQLKSTTASATTRTTLVAKKYNEASKTWESRPTVVAGGKVTFFSNTLSIFAIFETEIEAADIDGDYDHIEMLSFLLEAGIVQGTDEGAIEPYRNVRLSELAAMLVRMDNDPVDKFETPYPGVLETRWYYSELSTALHRGYITQEETDKNPDKWATVEEHVRMLFRYKSRHSGGVLVGDRELDDALAYTLATGLLGQELLLDLDGTVTREEAFLALFRLFLELYGNDNA